MGCGVLAVDLADLQGGAGVVDSLTYGGIHFRDADAHGLNLGRAVGTNTWNKAQTYFQGLAAG